MEQTKPKSMLVAMLRQMREHLYEKVRDEILQHPERTYSDIANVFSISVATVQRVAQRYGISRPVGPRPQPDTREMTEDAHE